MDKIHNITRALLVFIIFQYVNAANPVETTIENSVYYLEPGRTMESSKGLQIFCHLAKTKYLVHTWKVLKMKLNIQKDTYDLYDGENSQQVLNKHTGNQRSWKFNIFGSEKSKSLKINPFEDTCIGIYIYPEDAFKYSVTLSDMHVDHSKLITTVIGLVLFWYARKLSHNSLFYYICGITLGITMSTVILIYLISKLMSQGKFMYLTIATGWTLNFYLAQTLWGNIELIAMKYREWVMWYILTTSLISFIICYRFGPVTNVRTKRIIQWFLQGIGLVLIYSSSYFYEASVSCCVILILVYNVPIAENRKKIMRKGKKYWISMFPKSRELLTEDQYRKEGVKETRKALKELKEYCSSPECNPWKTVLRLKDPIRFAKFMEGQMHLLDDEVREHDTELVKLVEEYDYMDDCDI